MDIAPLLQELGVDAGAHAGADLTVRTPIDGSALAALRADDAASIAAKVAAAHAAFAAWRDVPAPRRGELLRVFGAQLRNVHGSPPPAVAANLQISGSTCPARVGRSGRRRR